VTVLPRTDRGFLEHLSNPGEIHGDGGPLAVSTIDGGVSQKMWMNGNRFNAKNAKGV